MPPRDLSPEAERILQEINDRLAVETDSKARDRSNLHKRRFESLRNVRERKHATLRKALPPDDVPSEF